MARKKTPRRPDRSGKETTQDSTDQNSTDENMNLGFPIDIPRANSVHLRASIPRRIIATLIDVFVVYGIISSITGLLPMTRNIAQNIPSNMTFAQNQEYFLANPDIVQWAMGILIIFCAILLLYFSIAEFRFGTTLGKNLLGLRVESTKGKITLGRCIIRSIWVIIAIPIYLLWPVDWIVAFTNKDRQRLLERWSKTKTVQKVTL